MASFKPLQIIFKSFNTFNKHGNIFNGKKDHNKNLLVIQLSYQT